MKTLINSLSWIVESLAIVANALGTLVVLALVTVLNADVVARGVFSSPIPGAYEMVQFSVVIIVFLQLADVSRVDRMTRSDGLLNMLGARRPSLEKTLRQMINVLAATFMGLIAYVTFPEFIKMWVSEDYFGVPGLFTLPWWPVKLVISIGSSLSCLIFLLKVITARDKPVLIDTPNQQGVKNDSN
jgi:TRAP-type C4-dicarboxylate transport system permease small subunit